MLSKVTPVSAPYNWLYKDPTSNYPVIAQEEKEILFTDSSKYRTSPWNSTLWSRFGNEYIISFSNYS